MVREATRHPALFLLEQSYRPRPRRPQFSRTHDRRVPARPAAPLPNRRPPCRNPRACKAHRISSHSSGSFTPFTVWEHAPPVKKPVQAVSGVGASATE